MKLRQQLGQKDETAECKYNTVEHGFPLPLGEGESSWGNGSVFGEVVQFYLH